jgi:hypothetical protein
MDVSNFYSGLPHALAVGADSVNNGRLLAGAAHRA